MFRGRFCLVTHRTYLIEAQFPNVAHTQIVIKDSEKQASTTIFNTSQKNLLE